MWKRIKHWFGIHFWHIGFDIAKGEIVIARSCSICGLTKMYFEKDRENDKHI